MMEDLAFPTEYSKGMTKRELIAMHLFAEAWSPDMGRTNEQLARFVVPATDALLKELSK